MTQEQLIQKLLDLKYRPNDRRYYEISNLKTRLKSGHKFSPATLIKLAKSNLDLDLDYEVTFAETKK